MYDFSQHRAIQSSTPFWRETPEQVFRRSQRNFKERAALPAPYRAWKRSADSAGKSLACSISRALQPFGQHVRPPISWSDRADAGRPMISCVSPDSVRLERPRSRAAASCAFVADYLVGGTTTCRTYRCTNATRHRTAITCDSDRETRRQSRLAAARSCGNTVLRTASRPQCPFDGRNGDPAAITLKRVVSRDGAIVAA